MKLHFKKFLLTYLFGVVILLSSAPFGLYLFRFHNNLSYSNEVWGQFGDFIGGLLNPLFALCGVIGLVTTLRQQIADSAKADQSRKVSDLKGSLDLLDKSMNKHVDHILSRRYNLPPKTRFSYQQATKLSADLEMCQSLLLDLQQLEPHSSILRYFRHKYADVAEILFDKSYSSEDIMNFFKPVEE